MGRRGGAPLRGGGGAGYSWGRVSPFIGPGEGLQGGGGQSNGRPSMALYLSGLRWWSRRGLMGP
jgi:hypothetical protein